MYAHYVKYELMWPNITYNGPVWLIMLKDV